MDRRRALGLGLLLVGGLVERGMGLAEGAGPVRIGGLTESWGPTPAMVGLRDGLLALGYRENEQFVIGVRFTQGDAAALPAAARELADAADLIFVSNPTAAKAAQRATSRIPIVFASVGDPLGLGLIQSFARPGGNITGVTDLDLEVGPKRLEVFRDMVPRLRRVLFPYDGTEAYAAREAGVYRDAARRLGIELAEKPLRTLDEAQTALARVRKGEVDGIVPPRHVSLNIQGFILETAGREAIPTMFDASFWVERGALASYGGDFYDVGRQAARLVDKILKGAKPGEIPVEVNPKIEFTINLKAARGLGLTIPPEVLYRADRIFR